MPKWGIHNLVLAEATGRLLTTGNDAGRAAAEILFAEREAAMLGAVGPDLFFFAPDSEVADSLVTLFENVERIVDLYDAVAEPIKDVREAGFDPIEDAVETLSPTTVELVRRAVERVRETTTLFDATVRTGLFAGVAAGVNIVTDAASVPGECARIFERFSPPLQDNRPESEWSWFDMLHCRRTGRFGRNLVDLSRTGTRRQRAYAMGYLSHVATDLVGHAFVNQVVGGPYRLHPQRHVVVESFMDARTVFETDGSSVNRTLFDKLDLPDPLEPLADDLCDLLHAAFIETYADSAPRPSRVDDDPANPGFLSKQQIRDTYEIVHRVLSISRKMVVRRPEEPFSGVADVLADALAGVFEPPPSPPDFSDSTGCGARDILSFGLTPGSRDCYEEFFEDVAGFAAHVGALMQWALEALTDIVDLILALLLSLPVTVLLALLYGIQLLTYEVYQSARLLLSLEGFFTPEPGDLVSSHGRTLATTSQGATGRAGYPRFRDRQRSHLVYPRAGLEASPTVADFFPLDEHTTAHDFISEPPLDLSALFDYAESASPEATRGLASAGRRIGNAVDLTAWIIQTVTDPGSDERSRGVAHTDWNLDSDRGYGYKTWTGDVPRDANDNDGRVEGEAFVE
jgi:hypothetical protein